MTSLPNSPGAAFREKYRELPSYKLEANPGETTEEKAARLKQQADRKKAAKAAAKARAAQTTAPTSPSLVAPATIPNPQSVRLNELVFAWPSGGSTPSGTAASTTRSPTDGTDPHVAALATAAYPYSLEAAGHEVGTVPGEGTPAVARRHSGEASPSGAYSPFMQSQPEPRAVAASPGTPGRRKVSHRLMGQVGFFEEQYIKRQTEKALAQSPRSGRSAQKKAATSGRTPLTGSPQGQPTPRRVSM